MPEGEYGIVAWMPGAAPVTTKVRVKAGANVKAALALSEPEAGTPHLNKEGMPYGRYK